ncbi:MAG: 2-C-methyl-D-erythritol 4-phosphate cytidylyltransferase [Pseudomonadota bacterium]
MRKSCKFWGVVPAAGVGKRMQADRPKQYLDLGGRAVIEHTLERLLGSEIFEAVAVALSREDPYWPRLSISGNERITRAAGGRERADSVLLALKALDDHADSEDWVLVHDAARPCITTSDIHLMIEMLKDEPVGGILALPVHDTLKGVDGGRITETIDRSRIWRALTPQMFRYGALKSALELANTRGELVTDEASALELAGYSPGIVEGRPDNIKITRPEDLALAAFFLEQQC